MIEKDKGLSLDDIYILIHNPNSFELNKDNMSQFYILAKNIKDLMELRANRDR